MTSKTYTLYRHFPGRFTAELNGNLVLDWDQTQTLTKVVGGSGLDLPNWKSIVEAHRDAGTNWGALYVSAQGGSGKAVKTWIVRQFPPPDSSWRETMEGFLGSLEGVGLEGVADASVQNRALGDFCKEAVKRISPFSGGVFIGELREAIHMIKHPAQALFEQVRSYAYGAKKLRKRIGKYRWSKLSAELWLESVFGWLPLISDVKSGAEAVSRVVNDFRPNEIVRGRAQSESQVQPPALAVRSLDNCTWFYNTYAVDITSVRVVGAVRIDPVNTLSGDLSVFGIGWDQVLPTAWELIPFSFVTDYFSNVGDVISSASLLNGRVIYCSGTTMVQRKVVQDGFTGYPGSQDQAKISVSAGRFTAKTTRYARSPILSPVPSLQFECPGIGSMKWLNLAALSAAVS